MIRIRKENKKYLILCLLLISLILLLSSCGGITPTLPIIYFFYADTTTINEGDSVTLSWSVSKGTVAISPVGEPIALVVGLTGSTSLSPTSTTTYTLTATNSTGSSTATVTITVIPVIIEQTLVIQPVPGNGKDSMVTTETPDSNYALYDFASIGTISVPIIARMYIQIDLDTLPVGAIIIAANLKLHHHYTQTTEIFNISIHEVTGNWEENTITWNNQPNYLMIPESTCSITISTITTWLSWDITSLLQKWMNGSIPNYGLLLKRIDEEGFNYNLIRCYTSNYLDNPILRPRLEITYYVP